MVDGDRVDGNLEQASAGGGDAEPDRDALLERGDAGGAECEAGAVGAELVEVGGRWCAVR